MIGSILYFFDVPVYRLAREKYDDELAKNINKAMCPDEMERIFYEHHPERAMTFRDDMQQIYGGCWDYNEIIGYIKLHFIGLQVRGEYFGVKSKRIVQTRRKIVEYQTYKLAPEIEVPYDASSEEIYGLIQKYLKDCQNELSRRYIDTERLDALAPYINWRQMLLGSA